MGQSELQGGWQELFMLFPLPKCGIVISSSAHVNDSIFSFRFSFLSPDAGALVGNHEVRRHHIIARQQQSGEYKVQQCKHGIQ